jgi:hypothetical protein
VSGASSTHGRGKKSLRIWLESSKENDHPKDQGVDGRMGLGWILGRLAGGGGDGVDSHCSG